MILILTQCFPSRLGGIESLISNLAIELGKSQKVIVFADSYNDVSDNIFDSQNKNTIIVKRVGGLKYFRQRKKIKKIKPLIDSNQIKLILADTWKSLELGIDYFNQKKIPVISLAHGNELLYKNKIKQKRIKNTLNKVTSIVANSNFTKNLVKNIVSSNINVLTIHPGAVDLNHHTETIIPNLIGNPILLTLARLEKRKGHLEIINSVEKLIPEFPNILYIIAGNGPELRSLKKNVKEKNLQKNIIFVGNVNEFQKKYLFTKTQLLIMPTLDETRNRSIEGFGIAYIEAAFFAIPSIASNVGGTPESVIENFTGKIINNIENLFPVIRGLLINKTKIDELGLNAQKRAIKEFTWNHIASEYVSLMNNITKEK